MSQPSANIWDQQAQKSFFASLKKLSKTEQGKAVLAKAEQLINHNSGNDDLLKGAESLMNMYTLKYRSEGNKEKAKALLAAIYNNLGEEEKASRFLK